jgi:hypothetical protein
MGSSSPQLDRDLRPFDDLVATSDASEFCVFGYDTANVGDCMQTLALLQHVRAKRFVLRDSLRPEPDCHLIANGWLSHGPFPRSADFKSIRYVGIHLSAQYRTAAVVDELRHSGPIGCRDTVTYNFLTGQGIPAEFVRCVTLTFPSYAGERSGIVCVDVDEPIIRRIAIKYSGKHQITRMTHDADPLSAACVSDGALMSRLRQAYDNLVVYRTARLVVTSKVHVALPSIASGTPVIYTGPQDDRFGVFEGLLRPNNGWEQFRWFRLLPPKMAAIPEAVRADAAKGLYLEFLGRRLRGLTV